MKIEKKFSRMVAKNFLLFTLLMIILLAIMVGLLLIITGLKLSSIKEISVIWAFYPLLAGLIHSTFNKPGVMTISDLDNSNKLIDSIEAGAMNLNFVITERTETNIEFDKKTKFGRILNIFGRENLKVTLATDRVIIYGNKNILTRLEYKIKRDFNQISTVNNQTGKSN